MLMLLIMTFIYLLFSRITKSDFYQALHERTEVAAEVYLEADEISPAALEKFKEKFVVTLPQEVIRLYDSTDRVSFIKDDKQNWSKDILDEVRQKKYVAYQENDKQNVGIYYADNQGNFVILASAVDKDGEQRKKNLLQIMAVLFCAQLLIQLIAGRWFAGNALDPIQKINTQVRKISATDLHLRVNTDNEKDEIGTLAANFNGLLERLEKSFDLQKMFVANVSHELKTPITNIIGEVEVAVSKDRTSADYKTTLQSVLVEADRLNDIVRNFLLLANNENDIAGQQTETVRIDELLWDIRVAFNRDPGSHVDIQMPGLPDDETKLYVKTNKMLLTLAITNIIQNGIKFSSGKTVICSMHFDNSNVVISIADEGIGIGADTLPHIFEPFYRSSDVSAYQGHGIGLYIARKIIELFNGSISVQSQPGVGSTFNIILPQNH